MNIPRLVIHSSVDGNLDWFCLFNIVNNAAMNISVEYLFCFLFLFPILLVIFHMGMELLGHMVILLDILRNSKLFFRSIVPFYITTSKTPGFQFFHILTNICYFHVVDKIAILEGVMQWFCFVFSYG